MLGSQQYLLKRTVAADESPVSVAEVKSDLRLEIPDDDAKIQSLIDSATALVGGPNGITGKSLTTETWALSVAGFDSCGRIYLPVTPVISIVSIGYYDSENAPQTMNVSDFYLYGSEDWAYVQSKTGELPPVYNRLDAVTITFKAGFGDADSVPQNIKQAIRLIASHWYEHRLSVSERVMTEVPMGAEMLLAVSRKGWVA